MAQMGTGSSQMSSPKLKHYSSYQLGQLADHAAMVACLRDATTPPEDELVRSCLVTVGTLWAFANI